VLEVSERFRHKSFRDEILGFVGVSKEELEIVDSMPFQRLRRVMQLDVANLVYPNASHNRFAHSLGVMFLATRMAEEAYNWKTRLGEKVDDSEKLRLLGEVRIAALLHDIGHYALSHCGEQALEQTGGPQKAHEVLGAELVTSSFMRDVVERAAQSIGSDYENIMNYVRKTPSVPRYILQVLDSDLDADKMDYLIRDSHHTGVAYGIFDRERLFRMIRCVDDTLVVDERGANVIESYLIARYEMYNQVYLHKTVSSFRGIARTVMDKLIDYRLLPTFEEIRNEPALIVNVDDFAFFGLVQHAANGVLSHMDGKQISDKGLEYLSKRLLWRKRLPLAFQRPLFRRSRSGGFADFCENCEKKPELARILKEDEVYQSLSDQLRKGEFNDKFDKICSNHALPPETVIVSIQDVKIRGVSRGMPSRGKEMGEEIIICPQKSQDGQGRYESLVDLIGGVSMNTIRVFAPEEIRTEIEEALASSCGN